jgi:hypothetical protein
MILYTLRVYYQEDRHERIEALFADFIGVPLSIACYGEERLALLASHQPLKEEQRVYEREEAVNACEHARVAIIRIALKSQFSAEEIFASYPLLPSDEKYFAPGNVIYLGPGAPRFSSEQISWLATCDQIEKLEYTFDLKPVLLS